MPSIKKATPKMHAPGNTPTTTLRTSVTGSGFITGLFTSASPEYVKLVIDGVTVIPTSSNSSMLKGGIPMFHRFNTGFSLYSNTVTQTHVAYILD